MDTSKLSPLTQDCLQKLMRVWFDFERQLGRVGIISRLDNEQFTHDDYLKLLLNLRQQVIEGGRWIARTASSFDKHYADIRCLIIEHAAEECRDYKVLENDFLMAGGKQSQIEQQSRNIGTEALHAFLMHRASQKNPVDLIGAMWIIEGLGQKMASQWAALIEQTLEIENCTKFMRYHGENDDRHMEKLYLILDSICQSPDNVQDIERTARVVAKLYALQLEEIDYA